MSASSLCVVVVMFVMLACITMETPATAAFLNVMSRDYPSDGLSVEEQQAALSQLRGSAKRLQADVDDIETLLDLINVEPSSAGGFNQDPLSSWRQQSSVKRSKEGKNGGPRRYDSYGVAGRFGRWTSLPPSFLAWPGCRADRYNVHHTLHLPWFISWHSLTRRSLADTLAPAHI